MKKTFLVFSIIPLFALIGLFFFMPTTHTGMGTKKLYIITADPEKTAQLCEKQIQCKSRLTHAIAKPTGYDPKTNRVTCECPDGRTYQLSATAYLHGSFSSSQAHTRNYITNER